MAAVCIHRINLDVEDQNACILCFKTHIGLRTSGDALIAGNETAFLQPSVLILPGGGYVTHTTWEMEAMAAWFAEHGFIPFVLAYSLNEFAQYPRPLLEASKAVWHIRSHSAEYGVDPNKIAVVGFSAGAHLATMLATQWQEPWSREGTGIPEGGNRPNATVTGYTPTTFENFAECSGVDASSSAWPGRLLSKEGRFSVFKALTTHTRVTPLTPPAFLWKTTSDRPPGTFRYAAALARNGVDAEVHVFADDQRCASAAAFHDSGGEVAELASAAGAPDSDVYGKNTQRWALMAVDWLNRTFSKANTALLGTTFELITSQS